MLLRILVLTFFAGVTVFSQVPAIEPGVSHDLAIWRAVRYSDVRYKLNLTLEKMSPVLKGTIEIRVNVRDAGKSEPGAVATGFPIVLDLRKIRGSVSLSTISNVSVNGTVVKNPVATAPGSDSEHLIFSDAVLNGENVIKLDFTSPILTSGSAITRYVDKEDGAEYIYSLFVPSDASTAFPVFDQPDLKARFQLTVTAPIGWKAISNARWLTQTHNDQFPVRPLSQDQLDEAEHKIANGDFRSASQILISHVPPQGTTWTYFRETKPISTYVFAFAAGQFAEFHERDFSNVVSTTELQTFVRKSQAEKFRPHAAEVFRLTREGVKYLETYFDYKFPFPKYDIVLIPEFPFGGMEHAGATFLREDRVIFPQEPNKSDYVSRALLIFHETAHQWFGDTVTMKWFGDLWLKEGFAEFMAYKTLEKVMPEANAWKVFYERNKQAAYLTDSTKGTTPIYQEIANLSSAKSAYGNIVYRKAPSFLRQAEFYLGEDKFQTAVRAFLKKHEFANAGWEDLVKEFEIAHGTGMSLRNWARLWVMRPGLARITFQWDENSRGFLEEYRVYEPVAPDGLGWPLKFQLLKVSVDGQHDIENITIPVSSQPVYPDPQHPFGFTSRPDEANQRIAYLIPNYQDYGYGIFLLDDKSRDYVLKNIQNERDPFLRSMMWGSLWDSVREGELDPREYVELVVKNLATEQDESTIQSLLGRVSTAMNYYLPAPSIALADARASASATAGGTDLQARLEALLIERMQNAPTLGLRITFYRAFLNIASTENARNELKWLLIGGNLNGSEGVSGVRDAQAVDGKNTLPNGRFSASGATILLKAKDRFDIVTRLLILGDPEAPKLLEDLIKTETSEEAKRYAYAAKAGIAMAENKAKYWTDYTTNKDISESWIEASLGAFNATKHADLTLPYLERALTELPNLKRNRKIFFVNGWLAAFIGGQRSEEALAIVNKFLADNPNLDKDLRLKVLENVDLIERAVKI